MSRSTQFAQKTIGLRVTVMIVAVLAVCGWAAADFNGDGIADLVVGVPDEDYNGVTDAGAINVMFGAEGGMAGSDQFWHQDVNNIDGSCEDYDGFGTALAIGDFDGDSYPDLAVGSPKEDIGSVLNAGAVNVLYGWTGGLTSTGDQMLDQDNCTSSSTAEDGDWFGWALAAGDFDGDGYDDLAIGSPNEAVGATAYAGAVVVVYGSASGLNTGDSSWIIASSVDGLVAESGVFGAALATGDTNGDGYDDLVIGSPGATIGGVLYAGSAFIVPGSSTGLWNPSDQVLQWHQDRNGVGGMCEQGDSFGEAVAVGDFNNDGYDDVVIGVPNEDIDTTTKAGMAHVIYGQASGSTDNTVWGIHQDTTGSPNNAEAYDYFGKSLTAGDFDNDGNDDLVIGIPGEDWGLEENTGYVNVFYGNASGLSASDYDAFTEEELGTGAREADDEFGTALAAGDFNRDGYTDLAVGSPGEDLASLVDAGRVYIINGDSTGLDLASGQYWDQCVSGIQGGCEAGDGFGAALAAMPVTSTIFRDGFESNDTGKWSAVNP